MTEIPLRNFPFASNMRQYWNWAQKGGWAVTDQALFAGTNFLAGLLLARWLAPEGYGAFSTAYSVFLLLGTLHNALWIDPMMVYGSGRFRESYAGYQRVILNYHWRFGAVVLVVFSVAGAGFIFIGQAALGRSFLGLALASPLILFLWLARRGTYVAMEPRLATYGGVLYLVSYLGMTAALSYLGWLNETSALATMGLASWISGQWILRRMRRHSTPEGFEVSPAQTVSLHWEYGRWALLAALFSWAPANLLFILLPFFEKLENIGGLRAMLTLFQPPIQVNSALATLLVTIYASSPSKSSRRKLTLAATSTLGLITALYCALVLVFGHPMAVFTIGLQYVAYVDVFKFPLAILAIFTAPIGVLTAYFKAQEKPQVVTRVMFIAAILGAVVSVIVLPLAGAVGAAWVMTIIYAAIMVNFFWRWSREA